jgi:hypothetical protein
MSVVDGLLESAMVNVEFQGSSCSKNVLVVARVLCA